MTLLASTAVYMRTLGKYEIFVQFFQAELNVLKAVTVEVMDKRFVKSVEASDASMPVSVSTEAGMVTCTLAYTRSPSASPVELLQELRLYTALLEVVALAIVDESEVLTLFRNRSGKKCEKNVRG